MQRKMQELVTEVKAARAAWLEQHGVPISMEFVRFANAIGDLTDWAYSQSGAGPTRVEYRHHGGGGLCESHTGGPHKIEQGCKNWRPVASGAGSPEETAGLAWKLSDILYAMNDYPKTVRDSIRPTSDALRTVTASLGAASLALSATPTAPDPPIQNWEAPARNCVVKNGQWIHVEPCPFSYGKGVVKIDAASQQLADHRLADNNAIDGGAASSSQSAEPHVCADNDCRECADARFRGAPEPPSQCICVCANPQKCTCSAGGGSTGERAEPDGEWRGDLVEDAVGKWIDGPETIEEFCDWLIVETLKRRAALAEGSRTQGRESK